MSSGASPVSGTKIQLSSVSDFSQSQGAFRSFHLWIQSHEDQHLTDNHLYQSVPVVALKSPRTIKVSPFWTRVHHHLGLGVERFLHENSLTPVGAYPETKEITPKVWEILSLMIRSLTSVASVIIGTNLTFRKVNEH